MKTLRSIFWLIAVEQPARSSPQNQDEAELLKQKKREHIEIKQKY
jgi:hypothetical protein